MATLVYKLKEVSKELGIPPKDLTILVRYLIYHGKKVEQNYRLSRNHINKLKGKLGEIVQIIF